MARRAGRRPIPDHPKKMTNPPTQHPSRSPSLAVISSDRPKSSAERRRLPRINLSGEQFRLDQTGKIFPVTDLSESGMALRILDRADFLLFPVAALVQGVLNLKGEKHSVRGRVRHLGADTVGCEFESLSSEAGARISSFLDPALLGRELKPIPSSEGAGTLWYHGPSGTDLLLRRGPDGQYHRMTLYVLGSYVQWLADGGLTTGRTQPSGEQGENRGVLRFETLLLEADPAADHGKLAVAKTLILSSNLSEDFKKWCTRKLEG